ncbi:MAG: hypothetical protein AYK19_15315 [Theionarchaea archaeon DG-70-1]|nr:MAG: hypothetical protein AYK19_15315 [Theionarchaea archaeon DG-70-1]
MKSEPPSTNIRLQKNPEMPDTYDVELANINQLKGLTSLECHIVFYPYSRKIHGDNITFSPFEEYVKDILSHQRSAYTKITSEFHKVFGLLLGVFIALLFYVFKPEGLFSVESIISVLGAYLIGKEIWDDVEKMLVNISKKWRIQYREPYYLYQLEKHTTLTHYSYLAKKRRYGKAHLLPEKIDFIQQSNSQTVRMYFNLKDIAFEGPSAHILSIHIDPDVLGELEKDGYLFSVKLSFNKKVLVFLKCFELFQSIDKSSKGCLTEKGEWIEKGVFYRETFEFRKIKWYKKAGVIPEKTIIDENM